MANVNPLDPENDIQKEVGNLATLFQVSPADQAGAIQACYNATKNELAEKINSHMEDIYAGSPYRGFTYPQWYTSYGFTYLQTDEIRELIRPLQIDEVEGNWTPEQIAAAIVANQVITVQTMTTTFAAMFIKRAFIRTGSLIRASTNSGHKPFETDILFWTEESKSRWRDCQKRLWIDFYKTGEVIDTERARVKRRTFQRG